MNHVFVVQKKNTNIVVVLYNKKYKPSIRDTEANAAI